MDNAWKKYRRLLPRLIGLIVVPVIFYRLLTPIIAQWEAIGPFLAGIRWDLFALAAGMFAVNQIACRITSWRAIISGLGHPIPIAPAARIWVSSELARYIPGMIWQVVGRAALAKPFGLPMTTCSISQVLELTICLLANVIIAVGTLWVYASQIGDEHVRLALRLAGLLIPALIVFIHPRVFYPFVNFILRNIRKTPITQPLSYRRLLGLLALALAGQFWLGLAIWVATYSILHIPFQFAWMLPGAYCLAWAAGFCMAAIAPSGIGIRELVLSATLTLLIGSKMHLTMDATARHALLAAAALLIRLWAVSGELFFAGIAFAWDWRHFHATSPQPPMQMEPQLNTDEPG